jgi:hypothetical protein
MHGMFSTQQQQAGKVSFAGKTALGIAAAIVISVASVGVMTQQTGASPAHWSTANRPAQPAAIAVARDSGKVQVAVNKTKTVAKGAARGNAGQTELQIAQNAGAASDGR